MFRIITAVSLASALASLAWAQAPDLSGLDAQIMSVLSNYEQATNEMDLELAEAIWSQDSTVSFIHPRGHERGWPDIRQKFYVETMGMLPTRHLQIRDVVVHRLTEGSAWADFYWDFEATLPDGQALQSSGRETQILKLENGDWQILHVHYSGMPTQAEGEGF